MWVYLQAKFLKLDFHSKKIEVISKHKVKKAKVLYITTAIDGDDPNNT